MHAFRTLEESMKGETDVYILYHQQVGMLPAQLSGVNVFPFPSSILHDVGYQPLEESLLPGSNHFPLLKFFREKGTYDYYWLVEDDVRYGGDWKAFFGAFRENHSDFLSAYVEKYAENPYWYWWKSLSTDQKGEVTEDKLLKSFNPIYRLSCQALKCIDEHLGKGWKGHHEVLIPTLLYNRGFSVEDFGGGEALLKPGDNHQYYTNESFGERPVLPEENTGCLYHPVKMEKSKEPSKKNCVIIPTGDSSLHRQLLRGDADFDLHLLIYDKSYNKWCNDSDFIGTQSGYKMDMTFNYLRRHPEYLEHYEYFFLMDDDIEMSTEEVTRLFLYMRKYELRIAQPSLAMSYYTYDHTLHNPTCVLRYTNFVEMMMPCFSREALVRVLPTFQERTRWRGIEWHWPILIDTNKKDIAIIDDIKAVHTRKIQSWSKERNDQTNEYLQKHHLAREIVQFGYIARKGIDRTEYEAIKKLFTSISDELFLRKRILEINLMSVVPVIICLLLMGDALGKRKYLDMALHLSMKVMAFKPSGKEQGCLYAKERGKLSTFAGFFQQRRLPVGVDGMERTSSPLRYGDCVQGLRLETDYPTSDLQHLVEKAILSCNIGAAQLPCGTADAVCPLPAGREDIAGAHQRDTPGKGRGDTGEPVDGVQGSGGKGHHPGARGLQV